MRRRTAVLLVVAVGLVRHAAAQEPDAGVLRLFQGDREIGREVFRRAGDTLATAVTIPLLGVRIESRMETGDGGRPRRTTMRLFRLGTDSLLRTYTAEQDGDSLRMALEPAAGAARRWAKAITPDLVPPDQALSPFLALVQGARGRDATWRVFIANADTVVDLRLAWRGDTAAMDLGPQHILMTLGPDGRVDAAAILGSGVRYERFVGTTELPPLPGLTRPAPDYAAPAGADYTAEEARVPVRTAAGDTFHLGCTLTKPRRGGPRFPAAITLTGSGLQDRDENLWPLVPDYRPFRQVAARLARAGIAVLRCDDRGFGASGGPVDSVTMADFAHDAEAQLAWLRGRDDVEPGRLAVIGHSEGGSVGPMVAADDPRVAAVVVMAGIGKPMGAVLRDQFLYRVERAEGLSEAQRAAARADAIRQADAFGDGSPYLRFARAFDPLAVARRVRASVLILQGALDRQVSAGQADTLAAAFRAGGNRDVTVRVFPGLNHLFLVSPSGTGSPDEYAGLHDVAVPDGVLDTLATWLAARLAR